MYSNKIDIQPVSITAKLKVKLLERNADENVTSNVIASLFNDKYVDYYSPIKKSVYKLSNARNKHKTAFVKLLKYGKLRFFSSFDSL